MDLLDKMAELKDETPFALVTIISEEGSTPRMVGAKMLIMLGGEAFGTIGGGELEKRVMADASRALDEGVSCSKEYKLAPEGAGGIGMYCGGNVGVFIDVFKPSSRLLLVGGGHIALALHNMAPQLGFSVVVVDDRKEYASKERFPKASSVLQMEYDEPGLAELVGENTFVVIITHAHKGDKLALASLLKTKTAYLGMIGSRTKVAKIFSDLKEEGVEEEELAEVHSPIGLDIGAESPEEIALSIMSEIVAVRNKGQTPLNSMKNK